MRASRFTGFVILVAVYAPVATSAIEFPRFDVQTIDPHVGEICYAVTLADVNGDSKTDIVAVTERSVLWYENPSWKKRVIIDGQTERDNVCIAAQDIDRDGKTDFALGAGWTRKGTIQWLTRSDSLEQPWRVYPIGQEPWLHRMRFADVLGTGKSQLVLSPLNKTQGAGVRLLALAVPDNPKSDRWLPIVLDQSLNRMHNHWHDDIDADSLVDTLTASQEGVHLVQRVGDQWSKTLLNPGNRGTTAETQGAGEIKTGKHTDGSKFITTIEPMHGNQVVVYHQVENERTNNKNNWRRSVIDDTLKRGHALWVADLNRDGRDEIIVGHSDQGDGPVKGPGLYVYQADGQSANKWRKHVLDDGGIATEDAIAGDINGDGWIDIVAGGRSTHNLKLYVNLGVKRP